MPVPLTQALGPMKKHAKPLNTSWWPVIRSVSMCALIMAAVYIFRYRDAGDVGVAVVFGIVWLSLSVFLVLRWHQLRQNLAKGTFSEEAFRSDPRAMLIGPTKTAVIWLLATLAVVFTFTVVFALQQAQ